MTQLPLGLRLDDHAVFESYHPGPNAAIVHHLETLAESAPTPVVWIYGGAATGKTHLLQAVCHRATQVGERAAFLPLAAAADLSPEVLAGRRGVRFLCLDDVHTPAGDDAWERALFQTFNEVTDTGGTLVVTATCSPAAAKFRLSDLASRLSWGAVHRLKSLDDDDRVAALSLRADKRGIQLPGETARYLMSRFPRDMRSLYTLLDTLDVASLAAQRRLTVPFVRSVLDEREST